MEDIFAANFFTRESSQDTCDSDEGDLCFRNVVLSRRIGDHERGTEFAYAKVGMNYDCTRGELDLFVGNTEHPTTSVGFSLALKLDPLDEDKPKKKRRKNGQSYVELLQEMVKELDGFIEVNRDEKKGKQCSVCGCFDCICHLDGGRFVEGNKARRT